MIGRTCDEWNTPEKIYFPSCVCFFLIIKINKLKLTYIKYRYIINIPVTHFVYWDCAFSIKRLSVRQPTALNIISGTKQNRFCVSEFRLILYDIVYFLLISFSCFYYVNHRRFIVSLSSQFTITITRGSVRYRQELQCHFNGLFTGSDGAIALIIYYRSMSPRDLLHDTHSFFSATSDNVYQTFENNYFYTCWLNTGTCREKSYVRRHVVELVYLQYDTRIPYEIPQWLSMCRRAIKCVLY